MNPYDDSGCVWVRGVFLKYGHLVRHLHVRRREILDAVCVTRACVELKTLRVREVEPVLQVPEHEWMYGLSAEEQAEMAEIRWNDAMGGVVDSLTFQQAFEPRSLNLVKTSLAQMEVDWEVTREFWKLLKDNQGLRVLRLDESLKRFMDVVSSEYFIEALASLKDLTDLENDFVQVDLAAVLQAVLDLRRHAKSTDPYGLFSFTQSTRWLTHFELNKTTSCQELLQFLRDTSNVESLSIYSPARTAPCSTLTTPSDERQSYSTPETAD